MTTCVVFDAYRPGDASLENSSWMAQQTVAAVAEATAVVGSDATRAGLEAALDDADDPGAALFAHGREDAVIGADGEPALDRDNVHLLRGRWAHAISCRTGVELAGIAALAGVDCFVGYETRLYVEWTPDALPDELQQLMARLVTVTTLHLVAGERDETTLRRQAGAIADAIVAWLELHPTDESWRIRVTAQQLADNMIVTRSRA